MALYTPRLESQELATDEEPTAARPVVAWAIAGAGFVALFAYLLVMWFVSGDATPTPAGPNVASYTRVAAVVLQVFNAIFTPIFVYRVVIKPWRRDGIPTADGVISLAAFSMWWMDTVCNSLVDFTNNTAVFWNLGSWNAHIPFWVSPNGNRIVEPPLGSSGVMYLYAPLCLAMLGGAVMRGIRSRWGWGTFGQLGGCTVVIGAVTMVGEQVAVRLGLWAYNGANMITIFKGRYYQFPLSEAVLFGLVGTGFAAIRYFRNDKGQMLCERGLDRIGGSPRRRTLTRILATCGLMNVTFLCLWQLPTAHLATISGPWPQEILDRPALLNGTCGEGTGYACNSDSVPINKTESIHIGPNGELIIPPGAALPGQEPVDHEVIIWPGDTIPTGD